MINRKQIIDQFLPFTLKDCYFRLVDLSDAEFILSLRTDPLLGRFLNITSGKLEGQLLWLKDYKAREELGSDFYIICLDIKSDKRLGLVRIYDISESECEIGSWLFSREAGTLNATLSDLFARSIAFEILNLKKCRVSVRKENIMVLRYAQSFNPKLVSEDELNYYFESEYVNFKERRGKLLTLLGYDDKIFRSTKN